MDETERAAALQAHDERSKYFFTLHEARLLDARAAVNTALLVNGASAIAVMTSIGSLSMSPTPHHIPFAFVRSLIAFGFGVFSAALGACASYAANHAYAEAARAQTNAWTKPFVVDTAGSLAFLGGAVAAHRLAYAAGLSMLVSFLAGIGFAAHGFDHLR